MTIETYLALGNIDLKYFLGTFKPRGGSNEKVEWAYILDKDKTTIGRDGDIRIHQFLTSISRQHGVFIREETKDGIASVFYEDLGSKNGTEVNGTIINPHQSIRLGNGYKMVLGGSLPLTYRTREIKDGGIKSSIGDFLSIFGI